MTLRLLIPRRWWRHISGSLRCVLAGHRFASLSIQHGALYARCRDCGALSKGVYVYTPAKGAR